MERERRPEDKICKLYMSCVPGPRGPAGPSFNSYLMAYNATTESVAVGGYIPFNGISLASNLAVTPEGVITIPKAGQYLINFWINAKNTDDACAVLSVLLRSITPGAATLASATTGETVAAGANDVIVGTAIVNAVDNQTLALVSQNTIDVIPVNGYATTITITRIN